jgi:hypothetical protein
VAQVFLLVLVPIACLLAMATPVSAILPIPWILVPILVLTPTAALPILIVDLVVVPTWLRPVRAGLALATPAILVAEAPPRHVLTPMAALRA